MKETYDVPLMVDVNIAVQADSAEEAELLVDQLTDTEIMAMFAEQAAMFLLDNSTTSKQAH